MKMAKMNLQFHATQKEVIEVIKQSLNSYDLFMVCIKLFPIFQFELISKNDFEDKMSSIIESKMIVLSRIKPDTTQGEYMKFLEANKNSLIFTMGEQKNGTLKESSIAAITEDSESEKIWKKIINGFKNTMLKGAWVVNPKNGAKEFYKNHYYTPLAKKEFENGVEIIPFAGWNVYILKHELENQ